MKNRQRLAPSRAQDLEDLKEYEGRLSPDDRVWLDRFKAEWIFQRVDHLPQEEKREVWRRHKARRRDAYGLIGASAVRLSEGVIDIPEGGESPEERLLMEEERLAIESIARGA